MKKINIKLIGAALCLIPLFSSCGKDFLAPEIWDHMVPNQYFINAEGLGAILGNCDNYINSLYCGGQFTDIDLSDVAIYSGPQDKDKYTTAQRAGDWFGGAYKAIGAANTVISRIDEETIKYSSQAERDALLGRAYFYRAYWYYILVNTYGDIPFLVEETTSGRVDYQSTSRSSIIKYLIGDMEFAFENVPANAPKDKVGKGACGLLLAKLYLAAGEFDKAISTAQAVVNGNPIVTSGFDGGPNLFFDLFSKEGPTNAKNTESLFVTINDYDLPGTAYSGRQSSFAPNFEAIKTPNGADGFTYFTKGMEAQYDYNAMYGAGGGGNHPTPYYQYGIWTSKEKKDMRGVYDRVSWRGPEDICYNHPDIKGTEYYGKPLQKVFVNGVDTLSGWFEWPLYKSYIKNEKAKEEDWGGPCNQTILRSAEAYLIAAEAYYWKGDNSAAAAQLNVLRKRAGADNLSSINGIADILAERARELYGEELRKCELVRISNLYALTGKACEATGKTYSFPISGNAKEGDKNKSKGVNFWFDWVTTNAPMWNDGKNYAANSTKYTLSTHHVYDPIAIDEIRLNTNAIINQNPGYEGCENNITPLEATR